MSDFVTSLIISGSLLAVMVLSQFGRREYTWHKVLLPLASVGYFGYHYLHDMPTVGNAVWLYAAGVVIGAVFGVWATVTTGVEKDATTGKLYTRAGAGFVIALAVAVGVRVLFVYSVENVSGFRDQVVPFMINHQLVEGSIAPFFVLMALTTVLSRVAAIRIRMNRLGRATAPAAAALQTATV